MVQSFYMNFRTISESVTSGWMHPGSQPVNAFAEVEKWVDRELENILTEFLK